MCPAEWRQRPEQRRQHRRLQWRFFLTLISPSLYRNALLCTVSAPDGLYPHATVERKIVGQSLHYGVADAPSCMGACSPGPRSVALSKAAPAAKTAPTTKA